MWLLLFTIVKALVLFFILASYVVVGIAMWKNRQEDEHKLIEASEPFVYWVVMCFLFIASPFVIIYSWWLKPKE